ncbi:MAG: hypothetical protein Q9201_005644 [Fulgogasparrea decipioides]
MEMEENFQFAVSLLEQDFQIQEQRLAEDHPDRLASQHKLARAYMANGQIKEAVSLLEQIVRIRIQGLAEDHPDRLASQHELARAYQADGQVEEAVSLLEQVVQIKKQTLAKDHLNRLPSRYKLARAYQAGGQVKEALSLLKKVVQKQILAEGHPYRLPSQYKLARAYLANGQVKEALSLLEHVVQIEKQTLAEDHPDRLASQHNPARAYQANRQVKEVVSLLEQVVQIQKQTLAEDHPDRLASQHPRHADVWKPHASFRPDHYLQPVAPLVHGLTHAADPGSQLDLVDKLPPVGFSGTESKGKEGTYTSTKQERIQTVQDEEEIPEDHAYDVKAASIQAVGSQDNLETSQHGKQAVTATECSDKDADEAHDDHDIMSLPSLTHGSTSALSEELGEAAEELANLLLDDEVLNPLCSEALKKVGTDRLERNFARLLGISGTDLQAEARNDLEMSAAHFVKARSKHVAACIAKQLDPSRVEESQRMYELINESYSRAEKVEQYLQRQVLHAEDIKETVRGTRLREPRGQETEFDPEESDSDLRERPQLRTLKNVKEFILRSAALVKLREGFREFVFQAEKKSQQPTERRPSNTPLGELLTTDGHLLESSDNTSVQSVHSEKDRMEEDVMESRPNLFLGFVRIVLRGCIAAAEFFEFSEIPLQPGFRRVRWTCFCGSQLYDDYREIEGGALDQLQEFLNHHTGVKEGTNNSQSPPDQPANSEASEIAATKSAQGSRTVSTENRLDNSDSDHPSGLRRRKHKRSEMERGDSFASSTWVLPIFHFERYRTRVKHLQVDLKTSDEALFTMVKATYHEETSIIRRFFAMRAVKKISYVKFIHAPREPDIHRFDDWPLQKHSPPWTYSGCPAKYTPLVGQTYLMHLWQNPSHSDLQTYTTRQQSIVARLLRRLNFIKKCIVMFRNIKIGNTSGGNAGDEFERDMELNATNRPESMNNGTANPPIKQENRSSYVFLRTPKLLGDQLIADDEDPPEAWGLYFEEGFKVHQFFVVVLFIYTLASLVFAIYWCARYGLVGPRTGSGAFAVSSWMTGLISLVVTVWFKWAD